MRRSRLVAAVSVLALLGVSACGDDGNDAASGTTAPAADTTTAAASTGSDTTVSGDLTVFAAASLTDAFTEVGDAFEAAHPDVNVELSFDGSSGLVAQIIEGAPADVFASADAANMTKLTDAELAAADPTIFATNDLAIIVAPDNLLGIEGVADLADDGTKVVLCAVEVPCGNYANEILTNAEVTLEPASYEQNVRGVASKVVEGGADAGIVYVTDVVAAGDNAALVEIPADLNIVATYPVAPVADSTNPEAATAFIEFLTGPEAQAILADYGFGPP